MLQVEGVHGEPVNVKCVTTISIEGEDWIEKHRDALINDKLMPFGNVVMQPDFDPSHPDYHQTIDTISLVHEGVETGVVDQVHYTNAASRMPIINILRSSALLQVQFIELDGDF